MRTTAVLGTFESKVLTNDTPVLLKVGAEWCGPCQMMEPILDELAEDLDGKVDIVSVDTDKSPLLAQAIGIENVPTLFVLIDGTVIDRFDGGMPKVELLSWLTDAIEDYISNM